MPCIVRTAAAVTALFVSLAAPPITVPIHEPVKAFYVQLVKDVIESEEENDENH